MDANKMKSSTTNKFFRPRRPTLRRSTPSTSTVKTTTGIATSKRMIKTTIHTTAQPKSTRTTIPRRKFLSPRTTTAKSQGSTLVSSTEKVVISTRPNFLRKPFRKLTTTTEKSSTVDVQKMDAIFQESKGSKVVLGNNDNTSELVAIAQALNKLQQVPPSRRKSNSKVNQENRSANGFSRELTPNTKSSELTIPKTTPTIYTKQTLMPTVRTVVEEVNFNNFFENIPKHTKVILYNDGSVTCLDQGNFPHPTSCKKFISCAQVHNGEIQGWQYSCPKHLSFDPIGGMCNWSMEVGCDEQ